MAPFDTPYTTFCWSAIVTIALSCTIFELFGVEYYRDIESGSLKVIDCTIRKHGCGFLFASNYGAILYRLQDIAP